MTARFSFASSYGPALVLGLAGALGLLAGADPTLAVVGAGALAFVALLVASFSAATGIFIVITFINVPDNLTKAVGLLLAVILLQRIASSRDRDLIFSSAHPVASTALALFLAWTVLGITLGRESQRSDVLGVSLRAELLSPLSHLRGRAHAARLSPLGMMFVLGCAIAAAYGLINPPPPGVDQLARSGGTFGDPNELAAVLVVGLLLSAALTVVRSVPGPIRVCAMGAGLLCVVGIALSLSRGGLLALGVALLIGVFVAGRWRVHMTALTVIVAVGTVSYFAAYASPQALQRITTVQGGSGRSDIWRVGWRMVEAHPIQGVGAGNFPLVSVNYLLRPGTITASRYIIDNPKVAHNMYLNVLAEGGIVGAALFFGILGFALRCYQLAWRELRRSRDRDLEILAYALFIGLVGFLTASFFLSEEVNKQLWILVALAPALLRLARVGCQDEAHVADVPGLPRCRQTAIRAWFAASSSGPADEFLASEPHTAERLGRITWIRASMPDPEKRSSALPPAAGSAS